MRLAQRAVRGPGGGHGSRGRRRRRPRRERRGRERSPGGCSRPSAGRVTRGTITDFDCTVKYFKSLIKTYGQELQNEGEGCPPPPGPNQWEILDETSSRNAQYGATVLVPQIQFGLLYMSGFITRAIAPHYKRAPKEALQLAQSAAHYTALGTA